MKGIILAFIFLMVACLGMLAQEKPQILVNIAQDDGQSGQIEIIQPVQVENLLRLQIANNRQQEGIPGYRIRIFSNSAQTARQRAQDIRMAFMRTYPDTEAYLKYNQPNFQIFVGDFRTKNEALRVLKTIERQYPGAFITSETIQISK